MIDRHHALPIKREAELVGISRGAVYYVAAPLDPAELAVMRRMGNTALYQKPGTSIKHPGHAIHPHLLRGVNVARANQVWALDTTYIPMAQGLVHLPAVIDVASRRALAWRAAIALEACHAVEVPEEAFNRFGTPEIVNTDQSSQFTATEFTKTSEHRMKLMRHCCRR